MPVLAKPPDAWLWVLIAENVIHPNTGQRGAVYVTPARGGVLGREVFWCNGGWREIPADWRQRQPADPGAEERSSRRLQEALRRFNIEAGKYIAQERSARAAAVPAIDANLARYLASGPHLPAGFNWSVAFRQVTPRRKPMQPGPMSPGGAQIPPGTIWPKGKP